MPETFDLRVELPAALTGPAGAWQFVERFAARLGAPTGPDDGYPEAELAAAELRLGLRLPPAVRELYARFGRRHDLLHGTRSLLPPEELEVSGDALIWQVEKFWLYQLAVPLDRFAETDPPVLIDGSSQAYEDWEPFADRFSAVCVETVMSENALCGDWGGWRRECLASDAAYLERSLTRMPPLLSPDGRDNADRWYAGADVLVHEDRSDDRSELGWLYVRALTREALDGVRAALPGPWSETVDH
ncbi:MULTISPECIES: SMI1/KNR4 family protein [unclassified Streptomyces]|uniref:SMI1/KNR4 family protein n=1 Tax=unclassified Streptomyces TaxID=2593676 RepID=UPI0037F77C13